MSAYCAALQTPDCVAELSAARQAASENDVTSAMRDLLKSIGMAADASGMPAKRTAHWQWAAGST